MKQEPVSPAVDARKRRRAPVTVKFSLGLCFLMGTIMLILSAGKVGHDLKYVGPYLPELEHDLGVALIISTVVGSLFELYRSNRHQMEAMKDVIDFAMGDLITGEVWREVQELIENKTVIRRDMRLRMEFQKRSELNSHESILFVENEYSIYPLRNKKSKFKIGHELDYQFKNERLDLPRWGEILIDPTEARVEPKKQKYDKPNLEIDIRLSPRRDGEHVFVRTERFELAHVPGSYNFYTPEFMKGLRLTVINCPRDVTIEVWVRPHGRGHALKDQDHTWSYDQLIFPGQGIEIKFISTEANSPGDSAPAVVVET